MPRAEGSNTDADEETGVVVVEIAVFRHVGCDVGRLPPEIKFVADLMTGDDRGLPGREVDTFGLQCCQEIVVDRVGFRARGCHSDEAKQRDREDKAGRQ